MRLGILQTGHVNPALTDRHGDYPPMFERLLRRAEPAITGRTWRVVDGDLPAVPGDCDAWLVTGSKHGVYEDLPWIEPLKDFLRTARMARVPLIGVCFGHQIMAEAFGGRAEKSERGWGLGVHRYRLTARPGWLAGAPDCLAWHAMHQDQVTAIPADATLLATSDFCPYAMLAYGDAEAPEAISLQAHPEFDADYARDLVVLREEQGLPEAVTAPALATFGQPVDTDAFARAAAAYLTQAVSRAAA